MQREPSLLNVCNGSKADLGSSFATVLPASPAAQDKSLACMRWSASESCWRCSPLDLRHRKHIGVPPSASRAFEAPFRQIERLRRSEHPEERSAAELRLVPARSATNDRVGS